MRDTAPRTVRETVRPRSSIGVATYVTWAGDRSTGAILGRPGSLAPGAVAPGGVVGGTGRGVGPGGHLARDRPRGSDPLGGVLRGRPAHRQHPGLVGAVRDRPSGDERQAHP